MTAKKPKVERLSPWWVAAEIARLKNDLSVWDDLVEKHNSRDDLVREIEHYEWLQGDGAEDAA